MVIDRKPKLEIPNATKRLRKTARLPPVRSVGGGFQSISLASDPRGSGRAAALPLNCLDLGAHLFPRANRDCSSRGAYWTNLYRYNGKCTGRRYRHTDKRDPVLWELISRVLESEKSLGKSEKKRDEVPERDELGFVCVSDRSGSKPYRLLCGWGLAIVGGRSFCASRHPPVQASVRLRGNTSSFSSPRKRSALSRRRCFTLSSAPLTAQLLWNLRWILDRDFRSILRWFLPSTWLLPSNLLRDHALGFAGDLRAPGARHSV